MLLSSEFIITKGIWSKSQLFICLKLVYLVLWQPLTVETFLTAYTALHWLQTKQSQANKNSKINYVQDHLQEVLDKWDSIDDEIWAKIIVLERNRRVAKAYARAPVLTVNGTDQGFDGFRIGLSGFENPMRDIGTEESLKQINQVVFDTKNSSKISPWSKAFISIKFNLQWIHSRWKLFGHF